MGLPLPWPTRAGLTKPVPACGSPDVAKALKDEVSSQAPAYQGDVAFYQEI